MDDCSHYPRHGYWELHSLSLMTNISGQHKTLSPWGWWEHQTEGSSQQLWSFSSEELSTEKCSSSAQGEAPSPEWLTEQTHTGRAKPHFGAFCLKYTAPLCIFVLYVHMYRVLLLSAQRLLISWWFFCHVLFCYFRSPFKIKQAALPHISPREETKKAQQMLVIVQMLVCLMYFWNYSGTWAMSRVQTQNRTCGLKSTSFSAAP